MIAVKNDDVMISQVPNGTNARLTLSIHKDDPKSGGYDEIVAEISWKTTLKIANALNAYIHLVNEQ